VVSIRLTRVCGTASWSVARPVLAGLQAAIVDASACNIRAQSRSFRAGRRSSCRAQCLVTCVDRTGCRRHNIRSPLSSEHGEGSEPSIAEEALVAGDTCCRRWAAVLDACRRGGSADAAAFKFDPTLDLQVIRGDSRLASRRFTAHAKRSHSPALGDHTDPCVPSSRQLHSPLSGNKSREQRSLSPVPKRSHSPSFQPHIEPQHRSNHQCGVESVDTSQRMSPGAPRLRLTCSRAPQVSSQAPKTQLRQHDVNLHKSASLTRESLIQRLRSQRSQCTLGWSSCGTVLAGSFRAGGSSGAG
jgi:hypothetical protein